MAEITAPIVTITLVLAAVFVPVAFIPGLTGRLYNQFAMTIVFSFIFSAINSLTFSPAMSRLFLRPKHGESKFFFFRWFNHGMRWLENSYDAFLDFTAHHWWTIVLPSIALLALTGWMLVQRPKAFIPDRRPGLPDRHRSRRPTERASEATSQIAQTVGKIAEELEAVKSVLVLEGLQRAERHQPDQLGDGVRGARRVVEAQQARAASPGAFGPAAGADFGRRCAARSCSCSQPPPIRGPEPDRRL